MTSLREKTFIIVTHQVEFLVEVDMILVKHLIWVPFSFNIKLVNNNIIMKILGNGGWKSYLIK